MVLAYLPLSVAMASPAPQQRQATVHVVIQPPPSAVFQQTVQQQQLRTQLQNSQIQQQLHQDVSNQARSALSDHPSSQTQMDQAGQAQQNRDRAAQQALMEQQQAALPRVVPTHAMQGSHDGGD